MDKYQRCDDDTAKIGNVDGCWSESHRMWDCWLVSVYKKRGDGNECKKWDVLAGSQLQKEAKDQSPAKHACSFTQKVVHWEYQLPGSIELEAID
jgi:hypothetical protein